MQKKTKVDTKFHTSNKKLLRIWDELQELQTELCFDQEIAAYYMSDCWINDAASVLDVGTGNACFLSKIKGLFPEKQFFGIDFSKELINLAKLRMGNTSAELKTQDFFTAEGKYDFIIMRLFWQHLPLSKFNQAFAQLEKITHPGSSIMISDAYDEVRCFIPPLPEFQKVISAYKEQQNEIERDRDIIAQLKKWANTSDSWQVGLDLPLILPSSIKGKLDLFRRIYQLWIELFSTIGELEVDFKAAKNEISHLQTAMNSFTQAGIRIIRLDRIK